MDGLGVPGNNKVILDQISGVSTVKLGVFYEWTIHPFPR